MVVSRILIRVVFVVGSGILGGPDPDPFDLNRIQNFASRLDYDAKSGGSGKRFISLTLSVQLSYRLSVTFTYLFY